MALDGASKFPRPDCFIYGAARHIGRAAPNPRKENIDFPTLLGLVSGNT